MATPVSPASAEHVEEWVMRAESFMRHEDYGRALVQWDQVIRHHPDDHHAYFSRALSYLELTWNQRSLLEDYQEQAQVYSLLSEAEAALGHYQVAAGYAAWAVELNPTTESFYNLAQLYDLGGNLRAAYEAYYTAAWTGDPTVSGSIHAQAKTRMDQIAVMIFTPTPPP